MEIEMKIPIDEVPAGPILDAAIAELHGWQRIGIELWPPDIDPYMPENRLKCWEISEVVGSTRPPYYSINIAAAWELIEDIFGNYSHEVTIEFGWLKNPVYAWHCHMGLVDAIADTAPLAICRAYLKAKGIAEI